MKWAPKLYKLWDKRDKHKKKVVRLLAQLWDTRR